MDGRGGKPSGGLGRVWRLSRKAGKGWQTLPNGQEGSGVIGRPIRRAVRCHKTLSKGREGSRDPSGGPGGVGRTSMRAG